jgi:hypothetical protein
MGATRWQSCNVLRPGTDQSFLWHFETRGGKFVPKGETQIANGKPLPGRLVAKSWQTWLQPRLNIAWLPRESVFLRVIQLPASSPDEVRSMVELQLEKLSPMPVNQIVWTVHLHGQGEEGLQTVVVVLAEREAVEKFLGTLEEKGFLADRLEVPLLDQLQFVEPKWDGAWIVPEGLPGADRAIVGWWYGGVLRSLGLALLPASGDRVAAVKDQLLQMAWAGEMEGWLTSGPAWHLVAAGETFDRWQPVVSEALGETVSVVEPRSPALLAEATAARARTTGGPGLLPPEFASRYRQQLVDRLWMRGLGAVLVLYIIGVLIYFGVLSVESWRTRAVERELTSLGTSYTNALKLDARFNVLNEREELKYAALDCLQLTAQHLPALAVLDGFNFSDGEKVTLNGTAPADLVSDLIEFDTAMRRATVRGKPMFDPARGSQINYRQNPRDNTVSWNLSLELRRNPLP